MVINEKTGVIMEYHHLIESPDHQATWAKSCANEFGRLAQGVGKRMPQEISTIFFIAKEKVPFNKNPPMHGLYAIYSCRELRSIKLG
eukprot:7948110-Ditylum_brightwellii.AAC.1